TQAALPYFREAFPLLRGTARWTEEVSRMEQLADTLSLAHDIFGAFGRQGKRATLEEIADTLRSRAAAGSPTAARLSDTFSAMMERVSGLVGALPADQRLKRDLDALADPDPKQRREAAHRIATYKPTEAIEPLFDALDQERVPAVQQAIVQALRAYGDPLFVARLRPLLHHIDEHVRLEAAIALAELGERDLDQQLLEGLKAQDSAMRAQVIQALERRGDPANGHALLPLLQDRDPKVRSKAIYALGTLRYLGAIDALIAATQDRYQVVRWAATRVLGEFGDKRAVNALIARLRDSNRDVRRSAATALGKLKDPQAVDALTAALTDDWWGVRESAQAALRKLKAAPSAEGLRVQLRAPNPGVRRLAADLLASQLGE